VTVHISSSNGNYSSTFQSRGCRDPTNHRPFRELVCALEKANTSTVGCKTETGKKEKRCLTLMNTKGNRMGSIKEQGQLKDISNCKGIIMFDRETTLAATVRTQLSSAQCVYHQRRKIFLKTQPKQCWERRSCGG